MGINPLRPTPAPDLPFLPEELTKILSKKKPKRISSHLRAWPLNLRSQRRDHLRRNATTLWSNITGKPFELAIELFSEPKTGMPQRQHHRLAH
jgi:hypothetical protein